MSRSEKANSNFKNVAQQIWEPQKERAKVLFKVKYVSRQKNNKIAL